MTNTVKMTVAEADPELRKALSKAPSLPITHPLGLRLARGLIRLFLRTSKNALKDVAVSEKVVDNGGLRLYEPAKMRSGAALLWIHGGGLILGHPKANDDLCGHYARQLGLVVVSVRYRLAPENPYPAAIDDCFAAWTGCWKMRKTWESIPPESSWVVKVREAAWPLRFVSALLTLGGRSPLVSGWSIPCSTTERLPIIHSTLSSI